MPSIPRDAGSGTVAVVMKLKSLTVWMLVPEPVPPVKPTNAVLPPSTAARLVE